MFKAGKTGRHTRKKVETIIQRQIFSDRIPGQPHQAEFKGRSPQLK